MTNLIAAMRKDQTSGPCSVRPANLRSTKPRISPSPANRLRRVPCRRPKILRHSQTRCARLDPPLEGSRAFTPNLLPANEGKAPDVAHPEAAVAERMAAEPFTPMPYVPRERSRSHGRIDIGCGRRVRLVHAGPAGMGCRWGRGRPRCRCAGPRPRSRRAERNGCRRRRRAGATDALTMFMLEHLEPWEALDAAHGLLRPGGVIIVQVPNDFSRCRRRCKAPRTQMVDRRPRPPELLRFRQPGVDARRARVRAAHSVRNVPDGALGA